MAIRTLAAKDLRLLRRDTRSAIILLAMPLLYVAVLGLSVGEGFGQKPDDRLRLSIVNLDEGLPDYPGPFPTKRWSEVVIDDLASTADIRIEMIPSRAEAESLIRQGKRSAILIFEPRFSKEMHRCSFLTEADPPPLNPLFVNGIETDRLGLTVLRDPTQQAASSIIEQVAQVTLLRVVIPWMIGKAFERVGDDPFMAMMAQQFGVKLAAMRATRIAAAALAGSFAAIPGRGGIPAGSLRELRPVVEQTFAAILADDAFLKKMTAVLAREAKIPEFLVGSMMAKLVPELQRLIVEVFDEQRLMEKIAQGISFADLLTPEVQKAIGPRVQASVQQLFSNYDFRAKTWAGLTRSAEPTATDKNRSTYSAESGGMLKRGALRYQILVPASTVMFAFFLVLTVGWLFVAERRQGTLVRLRAAPITRAQLLIGKLIPCLLMSLFQGVFLLIAGRLVFGMSWGPHPVWLFAVVGCTSLAAMGMAMLIAGVAKTEIQVALYGTMLVLVMGLIGGAILPRELMPENARQVSYITPHAWALDAYSQLLLNPDPEIAIVAQACAVLAAFGVGFLTLAWRLIQLE